MTGRSCWCLELFQSGQLTARNIDVVECSRLAPAVKSQPGGADARPALSRERAVVCRRSAARRHEPRDARVAAADAAGARPADDDCRSSRRGHRAGAASASSRSSTRGPTNARALPATSTTRSRRDSPPSDCTSRPAWRISSRATGRGPRCGGRSTRRVRVSTRRDDPSRVSGRRRSRTGRSPKRSVLCHDSSRPTPASCVRVDISDVGSLPADTESELFRIASEALTNVRKHSGAREVSLRLDTVRGRLRLTVADAGVGFQVRGARRRGFGLLGIEDRAPGRGRPRHDPEHSRPRHHASPSRFLCPGAEAQRALMTRVSSSTIIPSCAKASRRYSSANATSTSWVRPGTIDEGLRLAATLHPDVVLLDLKLPDAAAFDGVASFAGERRSIVVFTAYDGDDDVFRAIRGGARGYLLKGSPAAEIAQAIRQVHAGESYLSPRIAAKLVKGVTRAARSHGSAERSRTRRAAPGRRGSVQSPDCGGARPFRNGPSSSTSRPSSTSSAPRTAPRRWPSPPSEVCCPVNNWTEKEIPPSPFQNLPDRTGRFPVRKPEACTGRRAYDDGKELDP